MKPITDMTPAERDAEIVRLCGGMEVNAGGRGFCMIGEANDLMPPPSESLDTCIAAMEAGGVDEATIIGVLRVASNNSVAPRAVYTQVAEGALKVLRNRSAKAVPHD